MLTCSLPGDNKRSASLNMNTAGDRLFVNQAL